jgi:alanine racemase
LVLQAGRPTVATVHLDAIRANFAAARRCAQGRRVIAVVKADAYGHGAAPVSRTLVEAGCEHFAVISVGEAAALRSAGMLAPLLVLGGVHDAADAAAVVEHRLIPVVHHRGHLEILESAASRSKSAIGVHVEVDTGMSRMGVPVGEAAVLLESVNRSAGLTLEGVYTHFARADEADLEPTLAQLAVFRDVLAACRDRGVAPGLVHAANSAGLLAGTVLADALPEASAVRPGLMLYGPRPAPHFEVDLAPAMTLRTQVVNLREIEAGTPVGYAAQYRAKRRTRIATLAIGYADGVPVSTSNRGCVLIRGRRHPIAGRVSMDFIGVVVDDTVAVGDEAILFGTGQGTQLPVEEAAATAETHAYELLIRVGTRVPREYSG